MLDGGLAVEEEEAVAVRFVAVAFHAQPSKVVAVGREGGCCVVAFHAFGEIARFARFEVVDVEVGVGRQGVFHTRFLARHVYEHVAIGAPCKRLHTAKGLHRSLERLVGHYVG